MKNALLISLLICAAPLAAVAEGARLTMQCELAQRCTPQGACAQMMGEVSDFVIAPEGVDADGLGQYTMTLGGAEAMASGVSPVGPFAWTAEDGTRLSLVISTERTAVLAQQPANTQTPPHVDFLICEITL